MWTSLPLQRDCGSFWRLTCAYSSTSEPAASVAVPTPALVCSFACIHLRMLGACPVFHGFVRSSALILVRQHLPEIRLFDVRDALNRILGEAVKNDKMCPSE